MTDVGARPLIERKARLATLLSGIAPPPHYSDYHRGQSSAFQWSCALQPPLRMGAGLLQSFANFLGGTVDHFRARLRSRHPTLQCRRTFQHPPRPVPISGPMSRRWSLKR